MPKKDIPLVTGDNFRLESTCETVEEIRQHDLLGILIAWYKERGFR